MNPSDDNERSKPPFSDLTQPEWTPTSPDNPLADWQTTASNITPFSQNTLSALAHALIKLEANLEEK